MWYFIHSSQRCMEKKADDSAGKLIYHQFIAWSSRQTRLKTEQRSIKSFHLKL